MKPGDPAARPHGHGATGLRSLGAIAPKEKARQHSLSTGCRASGLRGCVVGYAVFHSSPAESSSSESTALHPSCRAADSISVRLRRGLFSRSRIISSSPASTHCVMQHRSHSESDRSDSSNRRQRSARAASSWLMFSDRFAVCVCVGITVTPRHPSAKRKARACVRKARATGPVPYWGRCRTWAYSLSPSQKFSPKTAGTKNLCKQTLKK